MGKRLPYTPNNIIRNALRQIWLRSRERAAAIKREGNTCQVCGRKGSVAKGREVRIEVHHIHGIPKWDMLVEMIRMHLLQNPGLLKVVCKECHEKEETTTSCVK